MKDTFKGHGTLPVEMNVAGNRVVANLEWKEGHKNFVIVEAGSDPRAIAAINNELAAGIVPQIDFTIFYKYATNNFNTAVLRSAYLVLFDRFGYDYVRHEIVQAIRRRICDLSIIQPDLSSLIIELKSDAIKLDGSHFIVRRRVSGIDCFLVIIRVRKATTTYLGAFMPNASHPIDQFEALMEQYKQQNNGKSLTIRRDDFVTPPQKSTP